MMLFRSYVLIFGTEQLLCLLTYLAHYLIGKIMVKFKAQINK